MKLRFFKKRIMPRSYPIVSHKNTDNEKNEKSTTPNVEVLGETQEQVTEKKQQRGKNKQNKKQEAMVTEDNKFDMAQELVQELTPETKVIKKDKGLIERTESSKIILTEDNKQILND